MTTNKNISGPYVLGPNGMELLAQCPPLAIGTKIIAFGYAGAVQHFAIYDDNRNAVEIAQGYFLDEYFGPLQTLDEYTRPISKKFGIGFYYDLSAPKYTAEEIAEGLERAKRIEQMKKERKEQQQAAEAKAIAEAREKYNYLTEGAKGAEVSANCRKELRHCWPSVKFLVRYKSFSGGDEITVKWEDGPRPEDVKKIINKYQDHHADSSGDYWDYTPNAFNKVFGGVSFVMSERTFAPATLEAARAWVARVCPFLTKEIHREQFFEQCRTSGGDGEIICKAVQGAVWISPESLARWVANMEDYTPATVEEKQPATVEGLQLVEYSAKSFAVVGNTKEIKDQLKKLGGRFNARLTCGAGWIFPEAKRPEVINALNL